MKIASIMTLDSIKNLVNSSFEDIFINVLNTLAPKKTKIIRVNNDEFMRKALKKPIMTRSTISDNINEIFRVFHHLIPPPMNNVDYSYFKTSL